MAVAVESSSIIIPILSSQYQKSEICEKELSYGDTLKKPIIPILLEPNFKPTGWLALIVSRFKYVDFSETGSKASQTGSDLFCVK